MSTVLDGKRREASSAPMKCFVYTLSSAALLLVATPLSRAEKPHELRDATVLIIRHGEKPEKGKDLSPSGFKRAKDYVGYFKRLKIDGHPLKIDELDATDESAHSDRSRETLEPLSKALDLKIHTKFEDDEVKGLVKKLQDGSHNGQTTLICWHHGKIPDLVKALGAHPKQLFPKGEWPDDVFGWLVVLRFDHKGNCGAVVVNENLEADDAKHPVPAKK